MDLLRFFHEKTIPNIEGQQMIGFHYIVESRSKTVLVDYEWC